MSIRLRLTLLYSIILALTLIAFSVVLYVTVSRVTYTVLSDTLVDEAKRISASERFKVDHIGYPAKQFAAPETYIQTRYITGQIRDRTDNLGDVALPLPDDGLKACQLGQPWTDIMTTDHGQLMIYSQPVVIHGDIVGIIQVARSMNEYEQTLSTLRSILTLGSSIATVVAFGIGWLLSGASLRPISRFTTAVQSIGAERDFGRRVEHTGPNDEIGRLASTFNVMLSELQSAYRQAEQSLHAQRRLVADASHELRTPLTTLRGNLGLLQRTPPISKHDRDDVLHDMVEECERLMRLVNDLLVLARADTGRPLQIEEVELRPLIEEVYRQVQRLDTGRPIVIDDSLNQLVVAGNRDALKQVLLILVDNALKYTPQNGTVSILTSLSQGKVTIAVKDTGSGIAPDALPHIFERFYRGDTSRTGEGAGLGLAIAKMLMEVQGGSISVQSALGQGTTVQLNLPQATPTSIEQARSLGQ